MLTFAGGGVKATLLTRGVELGNRLKIDCHAEPGFPSFNLRDEYEDDQIMTTSLILQTVAFEIP
jgi:hypothetical protein